MKPLRFLRRVIDHFEPSQRSTRVSDPWTTVYPAAKHVVAFGHDTLASQSTCGLATTVQVEPFHRSVSGFGPAARGRLGADREQNVTLAHDTPTSDEPTARPGSESPTIDQAVPFQRSTSACGPEAPT